MNIQRTDLLNQEDSVVLQFQIEIKNLEDLVDHHFRHLNKLGIWLFLAALGCWGVGREGFRYAAFGIAFFVFVWSFFDEHKIKGRVLTHIEELVERIEISLPYDDHRARLVAQLNSLNKNRLTGIKGVYQAAPFAMSWVFFWLSVYFLS